MHSTHSRLRSTAGILVALAVVSLESGRRVTAEDLSFSGTGTVRILASDWAAYLGGSSTIDAGVNDGGRLFWRSDRNAGDGQYIHFNLARLQGLTMQSTANVTLQNTNATWGGGVDGSSIATANGAWTATSGAAVPGATAISDATNATGSYGSGTSISWGIGSSTFQGYVNNASSFNGLAVIGGSGSQMHFDGPMNPYLSVATNATMSNVVTVSGGAAWNAGNYSFTDGVLTINDAVAGGESGAGNVTINSLGTVFVNGNSNKYWAIDSTRINTGGVLLAHGHSHLHNLTLAGGELAGIRPDGTYGTWSFDDATTVTGGVTSTISAQRVNLDNGNFTIDAGSTLNFTGSVRSGVIAPTIAAGGRLVNGASAGTSFTLGPVALNGGELAATSQPNSGLGNYVLGGTVTVGGSSMSTISADVRAINGADRTFDVADVDGGSGVDLLVSGKLGHYSGASWGYATKAGAGTMKISGANEAGGITVNAGRLVLEGGGIGGMWDRGLTNNAAVDFSVLDSRSAGFGISGGGVLTKTGTGTLTISGNNQSSGGLVVNGGTVIATKSPQDNGGESSLGSGNITINNGGTLLSAANWTTSSPWNPATVGSITVNNGGTWNIQNLGQLVRNGLFLNGGTVSGPGENGDFGGLLLWSNLAAGGNAVSTVSVDTALNGGRSITVDAGSQLNFSGKIHNQFEATGAITKAGDGTLALSGPNTYTGVTTFEGGVVNAATFANNGSASSLGVGTGDTDGGNIGLLFRGGTLQYTGSTAQSTDRAIRLSTTGGGGTIDASGSTPGATLSFTRASMPNWWDNPGSRTLTLKGSNTGANTIAAGINDLANVTSIRVVKEGTGTWVLAGDGNYVGGTEINGGTLRVGNGGASGSLGSGAITNNGTLIFDRSGTVSLSGGISGSGRLEVTGGGTVELPGGDWVTGDPWGPGGMTGALVVGPSATLSTSAGVTQLKNGVTLNGGTLSSRGLTYSGQWRNIVLSSNVTAGGTAASTISSAVNLDSTRTWTVGDGSTLNVTGELAGWYGSGGGMTKSGSGTLTLSGGNSYNGVTDITAGALVAASNTALGQGGHNGNTMSFIRDGATLALQGGVSLDEHFHVWGSGVGGLGAVRSLSGNNALTNSPGGGPGFALRANTTVGVDADTLTVSGFYEADGNWGLTKVGVGTLVLTALSDYAGGTTVNAGKLLLPNNGGFSRIRGALTVNAGATVETTGDGTGLGYNGQISSVAINGGTVTSAGTMHVWNITGGITMTGGTLQSNGGVSDPEGSQLEWNYASVATNASANTATIGGRIRMRPDSAYRGISFTVAEGAAATDLLVSAAVTEASGGMGITKGGAGTMLLTGANTYTGVTTFAGGVVNAATFANNGSASSLGAGTGDTDNNSIGLLFRGGTLQYTGSTAQSTDRAIRLSTDGGGGTIDASGSTPEATLSFTRSSSPNFFENPGSRTLTLTGVNTGANTFAMAIGEVGSMSVVKSGAGTWVLSGNNSYSGRTTIGAGTLVANSAAALGNGGEIVFAGGTLRYTASSASQPWATRMKNSTAAAIAIDTNGQFVTLAGVIDDSNTAGLTKSGPGWLSLAGTNTYTGPTTVSAGTLAVNGSLGSTAVSVATDAMLSGWGSIAGPVSVAAGGILAPGNSPGTLTSATTLTLANTSIIDFEINAEDTTVGGGINDLVTGVTNLTLGGTLNVAGGGDFTAVTPGTTWRLFDYSGTLTDNTLTIGSAPTLTAGLSFVVDTSTANQVKLAVVPEPGSLLLAGLGIAAASWVAYRRRR